MSGQPWSGPSGEPLADGPRPPRPGSAPPIYQPGYASLPQPGPPPAAYPPTTQFPAAGYPPPEYSAAPEYAAAPQYGPPPGYAQPGMPPGYAQPGMPPGYAAPGMPPGYPGTPPGAMPPGPPPRKSNAPLIALILAVVVLLCGGAVTAGVLLINNVADQAKEAIKPITEPTFPTLPTEAPTGLPGLPGGPAKKITVGYEVTGDGPVDILYTERLGESPKRISNAELPWKLTITMEGAALVSVMAVRSGTDNGTVSCRATVDGEEVAQRSREGTFVTASCIKMVIG